MGGSAIVEAIDIKEGAVVANNKLQKKQQPDKDSWLQLLSWEGKKSVETVYCESTKK